MLPFKFGGAQESVGLFTKLAENALGNPGLEGAIPIGFLGHGPLPLIAVIALICEATYIWKSKLELLKLFGRLK